MKKTYAATLDIALKDTDTTDGILERIGDIAFEHNVENDGSDLNFTLTSTELGELREDWSAFIKELEELFRVCRIRPTKWDVKVEERT